jgi:hypothetical protein
VGDAGTVEESSGKYAGVDYWRCPLTEDQVGEVKGGGLVRSSLRVGGCDGLTKCVDGLHRAYELDWQF